MSLKDPIRITEQEVKEAKADDEDFEDLLKKLDALLSEDDAAHHFSLEGVSDEVTEMLKEANKIKNAVYQEWAKDEEKQPTQPHRVLGLSPALGRRMDVIKAKFLKRLSAVLDCPDEVSQLIGVRKLLTIRLKRAYDILASEQNWEDYEYFWEGLIQDSLVAKLQYGNGVYEGSVSAGSLEVDATPERHGKGVNFIPPGEIYEGQFERDRKSGIGLCMYSDGAAFLGQFRKDKPRGKGCFYYSSGMSYFGEFKEGQHHGQGLLTWNDGSLFAGQFVHGSRQGYGYLELPRTGEGRSKGRYDGQWKDNLMHGQGTYEFLDENLRTRQYEGEFQDNMFHGRGKLTVFEADGSAALFEGSFKEGKRQGEAFHKHPTGERYEGCFKNGVRHGFSEVRSARFHYAGDMQDDLIHGNGALSYVVPGKARECSSCGNIFLEDAVYCGACGEQRDETQTNIKMKGTWVNGELEGHGSLQWPSGASYEGQFRKSALHGEGALRFQDGSVWSGKFANNECLEKEVEEAKQAKSTGEPKTM